MIWSGSAPESVSRIIFPTMPRPIPGMPIADVTGNPYWSVDESTAQMKSAACPPVLSTSTKDFRAVSRRAKPCAESG